MIRLEYTRNNMQFLEALVLSCFHQISHVFHWETSSTLTHYNFEATADRYECSSPTCCNVKFGWIKMDRIMNKTYAHSTRTWHVNEEQLQNKVASLNRLMQVLQNSLMSEWYEKSDCFAMANSDKSWFQWEQKMTVPNKYVLLRMENKFHHNALFYLD